MWWQVCGGERGRGSEWENAGGGSMWSVRAHILGMSGKGNASGRMLIVERVSGGLCV